MKTIVIKMVLLCSLLTLSCKNSESTKADPSQFIGIWAFDDSTIEKLNRSCLLFDLKDSSYAFEISQNEEDLILRLNNQIYTTWQSSLKNKNFDSNQILRTSKETGRFCGYQTKARLILKFKSDSTDKLYGILQTPDCDICPDVELISYKINLNN